jgi:hypothetical protein
VAGSGTRVAPDDAMHCRTPFFVAVTSLLLGACTVQAPAPQFQMQSLVAERTPSSQLDVRLAVTTTTGPQKTALCVRLEWLSGDTPTKLVEAREQCSPKHLDTNESVEFRFTMTSTRREVGDTLVARTRYGGGEFVDPLNTRSTEVPR